MSFFSGCLITATIETEEDDIPQIGQKYSLICRVHDTADVLSQSTISYQWLHNKDMLRETSSTLIFSTLETSHPGDYSCEVTATSILEENVHKITSDIYTLTYQEDCVSFCKYIIIISLLCTLLCPNTHF